MSNRHVLTFTGFPSDGKTNIAKALESRGCGYVSTDDVRHTLYPGKFPLEIDYPTDWEPIWDRVCQIRDKQLNAGRHVVIDSCAQNKYLRDRYLTVPDKLEPIFRELVWLHVNENELLRREIERGRNPDDARRIIEAMKTDFQDPRDYVIEPSFQLLQYDNNTLDDQRFIISDLNGVLGL